VTSHRALAIGRGTGGAPLRDPIRIGSRGSRLALVQAEWVRDRVAERYPDVRVEIEVINTKGDKILDAPLAKIGDKGLFTKELETALLEGRIDVAVHSAKDMPTAIPDGLELIAFTEREDVRDVFVPNPALLGGRPGGLGSLTLDEVPQGARVGTSSLRRRSQLLALRPDLDVVDIRGNVETRLRKLVEEEMAGTILAAAGLSRLGRSEVSGFAFKFDEMLPAVGQGALAIEARADHPRLKELQAALDHPATALAVSAERALLGTLEGGCQVPIAAHALWEPGGAGGAGTLALAAYVGSLDGTRSVRGARARPADDPPGLGHFLAAELLERGAGEILDEIRTP
jgi:hydroxymethylbilane synthase